MKILIFILNHKKLVGVLILAALLIGTVAYLSNQARKAEKQAKQAQTNANVQRNRADGLGVLVNSNNIAGEIENEKKIANQQQINANASNSAFSNSVSSNSSTFSNNRTAVNDRYCKQFPNDDGCR